MTKRPRGVSNTRCNAIVSSTTPRFGPRWPPVCESTLISSSRTSCASCGRSSSRSALMSAGERTPSSRRAGAAVASEVLEVSEEFDFVICAFGFLDLFVSSSGFLRRLELFNYGFACTVARNDLDLLLRVVKPLLAVLFKVLSFFVAHDQIFYLQFIELFII